MFNQQQFEAKVYKLVTGEINAFFNSEAFVQSEAVKVQQQILQALHHVIEETITQIVYGVLMMAEAKRRNAK